MNEDRIHTDAIDQHGDPIPEPTPLEQERRDKVWQEWFREERKKASRNGNSDST